MEYDTIPISDELDFEDYDPKKGAEYVDPNGTFDSLTNVIKERQPILRNESLFNKIGKAFTNLIR